MRLKELKKTVNVSWSPCDHYPAMLAAGSAGQQIDSSFNSNSTLELYALNLEDPGLDLDLKSSLETRNKFQKLVWSGAGVIAGGCDGGLLEFYSVEKLLKKASDPLLGSSTKHSGNVTALDINPYQKNLLASGAAESEIFIWDLNNASQPMTPGNRSMPHDHVQGLAWNQQVQHILGSTFTTRCVVWDLRKNEPIMKLSDSQSRTRWRSLAWHPAVATQLCIASEDDQAPVIQLWDLRLAASPLVTMEAHRQGVLGVAWSAADTHLLLSAARDGQVLCWDPNNTRMGGEVVQEVCQQPWVFEASWSPRVPGLLATTAFEAGLAVHSLLASDKPEQTSQSASSIMESFGGEASFSQLPAVARAAPAQPRPPPPQPSRAPAWLRRPAPARFGFGGKLVTFDKCPQEAGSQRLAYISQVVSEPELAESAAQLQALRAAAAAAAADAAHAQQLAEYCRQRGDAATDQEERYTWFFLRAGFLPDSRAEMLNLLGFKQDEIPSKFKSASTPGDGNQLDAALSRGESTETEAELSTDTSTDLSDAHTLIERKLANIDLGPTATNVAIPNGEDQTSMICRALVCGNLEEAVELCLDAKRVADALVIASLGSSSLLSRVQSWYLSSAREPVSLLAGSMLSSRWAALLAAAAPAAWRHVLAAMLTHCPDDDLPQYCEMLGDKLSTESDPALQEAAGICFLCARSVDQLLQRWSSGGRRAMPLPRLLERLLLARPRQHSSKADGILTEYAWRLAAEGRLESALAALQDTDVPLRARLNGALGRGGIQQASQPDQYNRIRTFSSQSQKGQLIGHGNRPSETSNTYNTIPAPFEPKPWAPSVAAPPAFGHGFPQPLPPQPPQPLQPLQPQPPQPLQPQLPPQALPPQTQPPRPGSVGPHSGAGGRGKYKVDPSVASAPLYNQYSFGAQPYDPYSSSSVPNPSYAPANNTMGPLNPMNPAPAPLNPAVNGGYYSPQPAPLAPLAPVAPQAPAAAAPAPPVDHRPVAPGWNDPPMMTAKPRAKQEVHAQAPITHPLFGAEPPQHVPLTGPAASYPGPVPGHPGPALGPPVPGYPAQAQYGQNQYQHQGMYPDQMYQQGRESPAVAAAAAAAPEPAPKAPVPERYAALVGTLDALRDACCARANTPQIKRKLEDVHKRLETLYDLLREHRLSDSTLSTLQACASLTASGDFEGASQAATSLAAGAEFASVACFLPALKVLIQLCGQLQVRVN